MILKIADRDYEFKFTFNSFKYIEDFDVTVLNTIDQTPFKIVGITEQLFYGALNHDRKVKYAPLTAGELMEVYLDEGNSITELFELLMLELEESDFFKNLQK